MTFMVRWNFFFKKFYFSYLAFETWLFIVLDYVLIIKNLISFIFSLRILSINLEIVENLENIVKIIIYTKSYNLGDINLGKLIWGLESHPPNPPN